MGPNILLNTMFSNTLSFLSSFNVSDQVSHPYKTTLHNLNTGSHNYRFNIVYSAGLLNFKCRSIEFMDELIRARETAILRS
jgi:hypothetical protein